MATGAGSSSAACVFACRILACILRRAAVISLVAHEPSEACMVTHKLFGPHPCFLLPSLPRYALLLLRHLMHQAGHHGLGIVHVKRRFCCATKIERGLNHPLCTLCLPSRHPAEHPHKLVPRCVLPLQVGGACFQP